MSDALLIVAAVGGALAGLGGLVASVYYAVRLGEWLHEHIRAPSVEILSHNINERPEPDRHVLLIEVRLYNPRPRSYLVAEARLSHQYGAFILRPVEENRLYGDWRFKKHSPIELLPKRHLQLTLGYAARDAAKYKAPVWEENQLIIDLDDGTQIVSKPFDWDTHILELVLGAKPPPSD
jgi:hypothetical protein